ncbi:MAG: hypothetical protein QM704_23885 [Anaeromyxobacteraceae bacterium]
MAVFTPGAGVDLMTAVPRGPSGWPQEAQKAPWASAPQRGHFVTRATGPPGVAGPPGASGATLSGAAGPEARAWEGTKRVAAGFGRLAAPAAAGTGGVNAGAGGATGAATGAGAGGGGAGSTGCVPSGFPQAAQIFTPGSL